MTDKTDKWRRKEINPFFSIGAKLVFIVTLIVVISLGSITVLVSWLVRQDLQISAEDSNFEANRRSAMEAEETLVKKRSDTLIITQMLTSAGVKTDLGEETINFFFEQNSRIAALLFFVPAANGDLVQELLVNESYFSTREIDPSLAETYVENNRAALRRAAFGETLILNAAPHFTSNLLAMFFPCKNGRANMVLFSPDNLNASFGTGINQSYLLNSSGDLLIHSNYELILNGVNLTAHSFIRDMQESPSRNRQFLIETNFGISNMEGINRSLFPFLDPFFERVKQITISVLEKTKHFFVSLYETCAGAISNLFGNNRALPKQVEETAELLRRHEQQMAEEAPAAVLQFIAYTKVNIGGCIVVTSIEYDKVFEGIAATTRRNIYLTIAILLFSIMLIWFFAKSISIPLKVLAAAARSIEGGEFDLELKHRSRDEIGILTASFQKMCSALHIFGRFTNKEIALQAMRNQIKPGGLPKHATVFFSDIREFTSKSENFTRVFRGEASDLIVRWLNNYFTKMIECVEKTGGTIDKFIGDAVMAHWGTAYTAGSPEEDAFNCVKASLMMRKELYIMNKNRQQDDPANPPIRIGCGINTGIVTAGQLGSDMRMEYTVIGDPVNLASRVEALTKPLGVDILIAEDTYNLVGDKFITEEMPPVTVKGKENPVRIFAVINFKGKKSKPQTIQEVRTLLELEAPDIEKVDVNADEKKYKISPDEKKQE